MFLSLESTTSVLAKPYLYFLRYSRGRKYTVASLFPRTARIFRRIEDCNFLHSTAAFITDFHEAQCFFTFATSIALLYGQQQTADFNGADSWQSLMTNRDIISGLILSGATPIILTQLTLHRLSISSIYSLTCSTLALIMSGVTATQLKEYNVDKAHRMFADVEGPEDCGRHPSLRTFCLKGSPSIYPTQLSQGSAAMMIFLWLVPLVGLWYLRVVSLLSNPPGRGPWWLKRAMPLKEMFALSRRATASEWAKDFISLIPRLCKMVKLVMNVGVLAAHVIIVYLVSCNFESLNASLMDVSVKENGWNAGQVIAMLLWVPVLAKYLYTILCEFNSEDDLPPARNSCPCTNLP